MVKKQVLLSRNQKERLNELKEIEFHINHLERPFDRVCFLTVGWGEVVKTVVEAKDQRKAESCFEKLMLTVMYQAFTVSSITHLVVWQSNEWQLICK